MAHAIELTIATGRTLYSGDPESDERIQSREVRVSVTYRIEPGDPDVPLLTAVKAAEAERALDAAWQRAIGHQQEPCSGNANNPHSPSANGAVSAAVSPPRPNGQVNAGPNGSGASAAPNRTPSNGRGTAVSPAAPTRRTGTNGTSRTAGSTPVLPPPPSVHGFSAPEGITVTQRLAIRSLCVRLQVEELELRLLLDERFGKKELEELAKEEAGALLIALQRGEWEDKAERPALAAPRAASD